MDRTRGPEGKSFEKINVQLNLDNIIKPSSLIGYIGKSDILNNLLDISSKEESFNMFKSSFLDNIDFIKTAIANSENSILNKREKVVLENLGEIDKRAKESVKDLVNDLFGKFLPKAFKVDEYLRILKDNAFLCNECYEKVKNSGKIGERVVFDLYLLAVNYLISYYKYLANITLYVPKTVGKIDEKLEESVKLIYNKLDLSSLSEIEKNYIRQLLLVTINDLQKNNGNFVIESLVRHLSGGRVKTLDSAIKKIFKSSKYREQFYKLGILPDQIGMMFLYEDIGELKQVASYFYEKSKEGDFVGKFNDRGVLEEHHENQDTIKGITPFVNTEIVGKLDGKELPFGELSIRMKSTKQISDIFLYSVDDYQLLSELISKVDFLNHKIYKLSQDVKVLRRFLIDNKILNVKNLNSAILFYLSQEIESIKASIKKELPGLFSIHGRKLPDDIDLEIELIINNVLLEKLESVIDDIAWELVVSEIKKTSGYNRLKDEDKRPYLKRLSAKFRKKIENPSTSLNQYSNDIQKIFEKYKREYKRIKNTAIFYRKVKSNISGLEKRRKIQSNTKKELLDL